MKMYFDTAVVFFIVVLLASCDCKSGSTFGTSYNSNEEVCDNTPQTQIRDVVVERHVDREYYNSTSRQDYRFDSGTNYRNNYRPYQNYGYRSSYQPSIRSYIPQRRYYPSPPPPRVQIKVYIPRPPRNIHIPPRRVRR